MTCVTNDQIKAISKQSGLILLYHSVSDHPPAPMADTLHNVSISTFANHLSELSEYFRFVSLEEFAKANLKSGLATITFDDGYKNILSNALPILEKFSYPCTLFLNPLTFTNRFNWRDKIRFLIHHQRVDEFLSGFEFSQKTGRFYRFSKHPSCNSSQLDLALDKFIVDEVIDIYGEFPYLNNLDLIMGHPLLNYGNHSYNHYVLSSLTPQQQNFEINQAKQCLEKVNATCLSSCFSAPFGGTRDINDSTLKIINDLGYSSILMSRQQLNVSICDLHNIQILERFMPRSEDICTEIANCQQIKKS